MIYEEFVKLVDQTYNNFNWRYGQALMNVLHGANQKKYNEIVDTKNDCYHDDRLVQNTLKMLKENWE